MRIELRVTGFLLAATALAAAEMRTWTFQKSGKTIEGEVVGFAGKAVTLKGVDGKTVSVPISYLAGSDRAYLEAERGKQWKEVEVAKLDNARSTGSYWKCTVHGEGVNGQVFVERLPRSVEVILQARLKQAAPITELSEQIEIQKRAIQEAKAAIPTKTPRNSAYRRAAAEQRGQLNVETSNLHGLEANRDKLQKAYDDSVQKTRKQTFVRMRNTGVVYKGLPVWECFDPRNPQ